jgi:hypothetical protein
MISISRLWGHRGDLRRESLHSGAPKSAITGSRAIRDGKTFATKKRYRHDFSRAQTARLHQFEWSTARMNQYSLQDAAHVVQLALTPVFLLSATATLLGVFSSRLARVADRVHVLAMVSGDDHIAELTLLKRRSRILDVAVVIAALGGGLTCVAVLILFLSELRETAAARYLFLSFGGAIVLTMGSLGAFVTEMLLTARGVRRAVDKQPGNP